jgi:hypothetical protein
MSWLSRVMTNMGRGNQRKRSLDTLAARSGQAAPAYLSRTMKVMPYSLAVLGFSCVYRWPRRAGVFVSVQMAHCLFSATKRQVP